MAEKKMGQFVASPAPPPAVDPLEDAWLTSTRLTVERLRTKGATLMDQHSNGQIGTRMNPQIILNGDLLSTNLPPMDHPRTNLPLMQPPLVSLMAPQRKKRMSTPRHPYLNPRFNRAPMNSAPTGPPLLPLVHPQMFLHGDPSMMNPPLMQPPRFPPINSHQNGHMGPPMDPSMNLHPNSPPLAFTPPSPPLHPRADPQLNIYEPSDESAPKSTTSQTSSGTTKTSVEPPKQHAKRHVEVSIP